MSNTYFVTLAYKPGDHSLYEGHLRNIKKCPKNMKVLHCQQVGKTNNLHHHLVIETDTDVIQKFRMRFRTYLKGYKFTATSLDINASLKPGVYLNYWKRDPSSVIVNGYDGKKEWDMEKLKEEAIANPDPASGNPCLSWCQLYPKLLQVGYKYPERPAKYLKKLEKYYDISHFIYNPKKLSLHLRFYGSKNGDDWDDVYATTDSKSTML